MNWINNNDCLEGNYELESFKEAITFVVKAGELADAKNHHPEILLYDYCKVKLKSTTIDSGKIVTEKDIQLAQAIDDLFNTEFT